MKCIIITNYLTHKIRDCTEISADDFIICTDFSFVKAKTENIVPDLIIGDFDSEGGTDIFPKAEILKYPSEKDDTDTLLACKTAIKRGYHDIIIVGGLGGRLDHTIANIQTLAYARLHGVRAVVVSGDNDATILKNEKITYNKKTSFSFSLFAYGGTCTDVSVTGVKYPLYNAVLTPDFPIGVSNSIIEETAEISVGSGLLLVIRSFI